MAKECFKEGKTAREFFEQTSIIADDVIYPINRTLVNEILKLEPKSVFEFGCGQGKNLMLLMEKDPKVSPLGIDISKRAIEEGIRKGRFRYLVHDDNCEEEITHYDSNFFDVSFTCSVLDHIPTDKQVRSIVKNLKRISKKAVIIAETLADDKGQYYYPHDYESMGFVRLPRYEWNSPVDGNTYYIWKLS